MVNAQRKAIELLYQDTCDVIEYQSYKKENKSTAHKEVTVIQNQPCRLSFNSDSTTGSVDNAATVQQTIQLFIAPELVLKPGSKIVVTHKGRTVEYKNSGVTAVYCSHQEVLLDLFEGWA